MKKQMFVGAIIVLAMISLSYAQTAEMNGTAKLDFLGKHIWRGFDLYDDHAAIRTTVDLHCPETGLGFSATGQRANSSGYENFERWDYTLYYTDSVFEDEQYQMNLKVGYTYYNYPQQSMHSKGGLTLENGTFDLQEGFIAMSLPNLLQIDGLVPSYVLAKNWPSNSGTIVGSPTPGVGTDGTASGFAHIVMFDYALPITCPITGLDRDLNFHSEFVFNDGVGPTGGNVDQDWSHGAFCVTTDYELEEGLVITPGICYQSSWEDTVNSSDEFWATLSLSYKF